MREAIRDYDSPTNVDLDKDVKFTIKQRDHVYVRNVEANRFFEKAFGIRISACFVSATADPEIVNRREPLLDLSGRHILLYLVTGQILEFVNSEWGDLRIVRGASSGVGISPYG